LISIRIYSGIARFPCDSMAFLLTAVFVLYSATQLLAASVFNELSLQVFKTVLNIFHLTIAPNFG